MNAVAPTRHVALLRGINVGTAKRIGMSELRSVFESLGYTNVRTVLQSGNVVFDAPENAETDKSGELDAAGVSAIVEAVVAATAVRAAVMVLSAQRFRAVLAENPFADATDASRMLISFCASTPSGEAPPRPSDDDLAPERIVIGSDAIYQWLPDGILESKLPPRYTERFGTACTGRNLRTAGRIVALLDQ